LQEIIRLEQLFLPEENYVTNPQYSTIQVDAATESTQLVSVPTIQREMITDLHEIGEGHFGKVYKGMDIEEN